MSAGHTARRCRRSPPGSAGSVTASAGCCGVSTGVAAWLTSHAWKLAAATAIACFTAFFSAVALSFVLRPTRTYLFPLLRDIDAFHPESAVLRMGAALTTALLIATTAATCGLVNGYCQGETCAVICTNACETDGLETATSDDPYSESEDVELHLCPNFQCSPRAKVRSVSTGALMTEEMQVDALRNHTYSHFSLSASMRHRVATFGRRNRLSLVVVVIFVTAVCLVIAQAVEIPTAFATFASKSDDYLKSPALLYLCGALWAILLCCLTSYFLKLQATAEISADAIDAAQSCAGADERTSRLVLHLRKLMLRLVEMLRPMCLTAQLVSVLKIVGLVYALNTFSISKIFLIKIALLAALAFAEYTAAFFLSFFLLILAVDMKRFTGDDAWRTRVKLHGIERSRELLPVHASTNPHDMD